MSSLPGPATTAAKTRLRALVVEPDAAVRLKVAGLLQRQGCDVHACGGFMDGGRLYDLQDIIVAPVNGDNRELADFVERVRATSGDAQPYILGLTSGGAVTLDGDASHYGMNDVLPWPVDAVRLATRLTAIIRERTDCPGPGFATAPHDGWSSPASQVLLEQLPAAVAVLDRDMIYLAANQRWRKEFQITGLQVIGQSHYQIFPDLHPAWRDLYARCLAGHRERSDDDLLVRPDGSQDWVRWDIQPWQYAGREIGGLILSCTVVSGNRRDLPAVAFEQDLAHSLLKSTSAPLVFVDTRGRIVKANPAAREYSGGVSIAEGQTFFWNALVPPGRREPARRRVLELLTMAGPDRRETWPQPAGPALASSLPGRASPASWSVFPRRRPDGALEGLIFLGFEPVPVNTPHAMTDEATLTVPAPGPQPIAENRGGDFRQIAEAAPFGMIVLNEEAEVLYANPQHRAVLGFSVAECGGMVEWLERACAADAEFRQRVLEEWWERVWRRRSAWTCSMRTADGILKEVEFRPSQLPDHKLLLTVFDVTDAQLEEQAVRASEARYRGLFQNCAAGVAILNASGNITEVNPVFERLTGCTRMEMRRSSLAGFLPEADAARVRESAAAGELPRGEIITEVKARDGTVTKVALSLSVLKNEEGVPVYTACYLHPLSDLPSSAPSPSPWRGADWSRTVPDWVLLIDSAGRILEHSDARDFAGVIPRGDGVAGRTLEEAAPAISDLLPLDVMIERLRENPGAETRCEFSTALTAGGRPRFIEARMISLTKQESEERYGLALRDLTAVAGRPQPSAGVLPWLRNLSLPVLLSNDRGRITGMNPAAEILLGRPAAEFEGSGLCRVFRPDNPKSFSTEISSELTRHRCWKTRTVFHRHDGSTGDADVELVPAHDETTGSRGFITVIRPVAAEPDEPGESVPAKPVVTLHRARNDLQVLSSLLTLQADRAAEPSARDALIAGKDRLSAVALIYRLINSEDDTVDFAHYAGELGRLLLESHKVPAGRIEVDTAFEPVRLPQKLAVTLGIILEELLAVSIAESFPGESGGVIRVSFTAGGGEGVLIVRDNGSLLTESLRARRTESFAWQVVQTLAEQIGGVLTLLSDLENQVRLRFRLTPP